MLPVGQKADEVMTEDEWNTMPSLQRERPRSLGHTVREHPPAFPVTIRPGKAIRRQALASHETG
jgi:hypothetical protein